MAWRMSRTSFMFFSLSSTIRTRSPAIRLPPPAYGEREHEAAADADLALCPDAAAVQLDEPLREREAEPRPFVLPRARVGLLELRDDAVEVLGRDARPGVGHRELDLLGAAARADGDAAG